MTRASVRRRALISVADKKGVVPFAEQLAALSFEILSTGGTAGLLQEAGLDVIRVSDVTGFPEIMDGRVKTLHPKIHGGLLARSGTDDAALAEHGIEPIDLVVVNLYPFASVIASPHASYDDAIENIDIGGPAMIRAAAKNHSRVTVAVAAADYEAILAAFEADGPSFEMRRMLAAKAFAHTAAYDAMITCYLNRQDEAGDSFPEQLLVGFDRSARLRYGENPHQHGAAYVDPAAAGASVLRSRPLQGKALSYNNFVDADAAMSCALSFEETACVIVKHANPCGVALGGTALEAYERAYAADPTSAFGGVIALNRELDPDTAAAIIARQFVEVVVAPRIPQRALAILSDKPEVRALAIGDQGLSPGGRSLKSLEGGLLVQDTDRVFVPDAFDVVTRTAPTEEQLRDIEFAWRVVQFVKSNAIVLAGGGQTLGIGAGQMSRIMSTRIAAWQAAEFGFSLDRAVLASDAFFPFRDNVDLAAEHGVRAIVQPGGSRRDRDVIEAADAHGIAMVFSGRRHFRH